MKTEMRLLIVLLAVVALFTGVAAAQGDGGGLELVDLFIDILRSIPELQPLFRIIDFLISFFGL